VSLRHAKRKEADTDRMNTETQMIKVLNRSENPMDERETWWRDQNLYMHDANGRECVVRDDDRHATWDAVFWTHWAGKMEHWRYVCGGGVGLGVSDERRDPRHVAGQLFPERERRNWDPPREE